ncbi:MAG TPA: biopolymer transporter ExbD [Phycisphaerae bacterium]|nr:biopolymer transporter ExbD [Phycisphaerae bacterium]
MKRPPKETSIALNLAPMVDVMMCLLIFFMLATKMVEQENSQIDLPLAKAAKEVEKKELGNRFVINVRDAALRGGEGADYLVREEMRTLDEVRDLLEHERELDPDVNCVVRADRGIAYRYVQDVMAACARANVRNITFGALRAEAGGG